MTSTTLDGAATPYVINAGTTVDVTDGNYLYLLGTIDNLGTIFMNGVGAATNADLVVTLLASPIVTLIGGGTVKLTDVFDSQIAGSHSAAESLVNVDNTIIGTGLIGEFSSASIDVGHTLYPLSLTNEAAGVIDANGTVAPTGMSPPSGIFIETGTLALVNSGLMEATGIGGLFIEASTIDQSGGGTILASGAGVSVAVQSDSDTTDIIGGTLRTTGGGEIFLENAILDGSITAVTIDADLTADISALIGTIDNIGTIAEPTSSFGGGIFLASPTVTLKGDGTVLDPIWTNQNGSLETLVNFNTIAGIGQIGIATIDDSAFGPLGGSSPVSLTNEAGGIIDATGTEANEGGGGYVIGDGMYIYAGGTALKNNGLLEATGIGGLDIADTTLDQSGGGTLLADGAGVAVYLQTVDLIGGVLDVTNGGTIDFNGGANTLQAVTGGITISAGGVLEISTFIVAGTLDLKSDTIDNRGTFIDAATLVLTSPTLTLGGGGALQVSGIVNADGTRKLVNADNTISGGGTISDAALALTNAAAGAIEAVELDVGGTLANAGLLENVSIGFAIATTVINTGTGILEASGAGVTLGLYNADIVGGTLSGIDGGSFQIGSDYSGAGNAVTLDGSAAAVTITAGTTLFDVYHTYDASFTFDNDGGLVLVGSIDLLGGSIIGADPQAVVSGGFAIPNAGVLAGFGTIDGYVSNTGTLLARGGTLSVTGDVDGSGGIVIGPGGAFALGGASQQTVDFLGSQNDRLVLNTPSAFTGTLADMTYGDNIVLGTSDVTSAVATGNTLAVKFADASTIDYTLANLHPGTHFIVTSATPAPTEIYDFTYVGVGTSNEPTYSATGIGSFTVDTGGGSAGLSSVVGFTLDLQVSTTGGPSGAGTDTFNYSLFNLKDFSASFGSGETLASLTLTAAYPEESADHTVPQDFDVTSLHGADTDNSVLGVATLGSIEISKVGALLSEIEVACFAEGTRIRTARGDIAVEALRIGDLAVTSSGRHAPIAWLGHRRVDAARHPRPHDIMPIRVAEDAFAPGSPARDVWLSPDHAVFIDGVLIPIRYLVNDATVRQVAVPSVTYWHVELDRHDILLANNLPAESFLDTGNRAAFAGGRVVQQHPDFALRIWRARACAELVRDGAEREAARSHLLDRAESLGHVVTANADLHLAVAGHRVAPTRHGRRYRFHVPPDAGTARIVSRSAVPAHLCPASDDHRRLGVAIGRISCDGAAIPLNDARLAAGWHTAEAGWRWTDGNAALPLNGAVVDIEIALSARYWLPPELGAPRMRSGAR